MSDLKDAVAKVKNLGGLFKAVMVIADEVDKVEKLDQLAGEANARIASAKDDHEKLIKAISKEKAASESALASIKGELATAQSDAESARSEAKAILSKAKDDAAELISVAKDKAKALIASAEAKVAEADRDAKAIVDGGLDTEKALESKRAELSDIESRIEKARETIKKMVGG